MDDTQLTSSQVASSAAKKIAQSPLSAARFVPGTIIADRYRVVAQVGCGGMGEVYRADDLRLGQSVALKFLPQSLTHDQTALERLKREVRTARQVSHPNVCRVFDMGEADGVPFITMEFIDGEDLASLLQRIGRLQPAKALQLAHQLCAGLAEIHAFGILHRDLKPANIMLDGRGNLRVTDFGLAAVAHDIPAEEAWAGTPAYMAPEQLAGEKPTHQSDIYALGLVLFELFTGKPAFESRRTRTSSTLKPSAVAKDIDGVIECVILRCLERDPGSRPRSASVVASGLPGGDPLAAAIAAGETPSPEMVAAAVDEPAISVGRAWLLLGVFLLCVAGIVFLAGHAFVCNLAPPEKPAELLAYHAQQIIKSLGYTAAPADCAFWFGASFDQLDYLSRHEDSRKWTHGLSQSYPGPLRLYYRQSPAPMSYPGGMSESEPAMTLAGMVLAELDQQGRLLLFRAVPPQIEDYRAAWPDPDWAALFRAAALPQADFALVAPKWRPPMAFDKQLAWEGSYGGRGFHVTAASFHGRTVYFEVFGPWDGTARPSTQSPVYLVSLLIFASLGLWIAGIVLARRNWRLGRGDRKAAFNLGAIVFSGIVLSLALPMHHAFTPAEYLNWIIITGIALHFGIFTAVLYMALEPMVRRRWPNYLVSWTRLFAGRFANPRVGRDVLAGIAFGALAMSIETLESALPSWVNLPREVPFVNGNAVDSFPAFLSSLVSLGTQAVIFSIGIVAVLLFLTVLVRKQSIAFVLLFVFVAATIHVVPAVANPWLWVGASVVEAAIALFVLTRYGLLGLVAFSFIGVLYSAPLTVDVSRWYFGRATLVLLMVVAVALWALRTALGGRSAFGRAILDD